MKGKKQTKIMCFAGNMSQIDKKNKKFGKRKE